MLEVLERFPTIGAIDPRLTPIQNYLALPPGEKALYNQYALIKLEAEMRRPPVFTFGAR